MRENLILIIKYKYMDELYIHIFVNMEIHRLTSAMMQLTFPPGPLKRGTQLDLETDSHQISFESVFPLLRHFTTTLHISLMFWLLFIIFLLLVCIEKHSFKYGIEENHPDLSVCFGCP